MTAPFPCRQTSTFHFFQDCFSLFPCFYPKKPAGIPHSCFHIKFAPMPSCLLHEKPANTAGDFLQQFLACAILYQSISALPRRKNVTTTARHGRVSKSLKAVGSKALWCLFPSHESFPLILESDPSNRCSFPTNRNRGQIPTPEGKAG